MPVERIEKIKNSLLAVAPDIFANSPVLFAYLYGSYATGLVHPFSDLDIGIYVEEIRRSQYLNIELSLALQTDEKLGSGVGAEVRIMNSLPLVVIGSIITEGILIFSRNDVLRVDFESSVRRAYFDFLPVVHGYRSMYVNSIVS
jgi:predicted nucleotidyltransferase